MAKTTTIRISIEMNDQLEAIGKLLKRGTNATAVIGLENLINKGVGAFIPHTVTSNKS